MEGQRLPGALNPSHFPAKLWHLVNSPRFGSVRWDAGGEGLLIDQRLFERETTNFASFVRQLNLYGFRKLGPGPLQEPAGGDGGSSAGPLLHFHSPHFRRDRPELLVRLKRLTSAKKAKLAAGLELPSRPAQRCQRPPSTLGEAARPEKKWTQKSAHVVKEDNAGPVREREEGAEPGESSRSLSLSELWAIQKDFGRCPHEPIVTWLL
ncbi:heat shock factor protein 5-like [Ara ararauna]